MVLAAGSRPRETGPESRQASGAHGGSDGRRRGLNLFDRREQAPPGRDLVTTREFDAVQLPERRRRHAFDDLNGHQSGTLTARIDLPSKLPLLLHLDRSDCRRRQQRECHIAGQNRLLDLLGQASPRPQVPRLHPHPVAQLLQMRRDPLGPSLVGPHMADEEVVEPEADGLAPEALGQRFPVGVVQRHDRPDAPFGQMASKPFVRGQQRALLVRSVADGRQDLFVGVEHLVGDLDVPQ